MSILVRKLVIRYATVSDPFNQQILEIEADQESTFKNPTCDMSWTENITNLIRLDIGGNRLAKINLDPIRHMTTIRHLDLSENKLDSIDLAPLENFKNLETLDLSYNNLKKIDLFPLMGCERLRFVYVHENQLETVNIAPLMHLEHIKNVRISQPSEKSPYPVYASTLNTPQPIFLDSVQALFCDTKRPCWLRCHRETEMIECSPEPYDNLVAIYGWNTVKEHLVSLRKRITSKNDFKAQKVFLDALNLSELACYDGSVSDIIDLLPTEGTYKEGVDAIRIGLISLLSEQLENGGSTLFFDVEKLAITQGSVLIPLIVSRRAKELREITLYDYNGKVNLIPLWLTGFGFSLLKAQGCKKKTDRHSIPTVIDAPLTKLGIDIHVKKTTSKRKYDSLVNSPSRPLLDYVLSLVG